MRDQGVPHHVADTALVHFLRGCVAHGFASAQTVRNLPGRSPVAGLRHRGAVRLPPVAAAVQLGEHVLLTTLVWLHLLRAGFRMARYVGQWLKSAGDSSGDLARFDELDEKTIEVTNAGASVASSVWEDQGSEGKQTVVVEPHGAAGSPHKRSFAKWRTVSLVSKEEGSSAHWQVMTLAAPGGTVLNDAGRVLSIRDPSADGSCAGASQHSVHSVQRWLEFEVKRCPRSLWTGACKSLSVVSVSGTDISRIADYAENLRMWTEPVALQILQTMFPTIRIWPRDSSSMVIRTIHDILSGLGLEDNQWHYKEILDYVRQIPREQDCWEAEGS
eukprot:Skav221924  [mRNA]  locus=scaffold195:102861:114197:+ [translate_table: standard]